MDRGIGCSIRLIDGASSGTLRCTPRSTKAIPAVRALAKRELQELFDYADERVAGVRFCLLWR